MALTLALLMGVSGGALAESDDLQLLDVAQFSDWYYQNPSTITDVGDPQILRAEDAYWCFATSSGRGYRVWRSEDLVHWEKQKEHAFLLNFDSWARGAFWAPEVYAYRGKYYMFYSASGEGVTGMRIGIAASDAPGGPYVDIAPQPLFDPGFSVIDASFFVDDDGQPYLYYARDCSENVVDGVHESHIYGVKLADDLSAIVGEPTLLLTPDQVWETDSGLEWLWNEGPIVLKHEGKYHLYYSANFYGSKEYGAGVAQSSSPLGPFEKRADNPILRYIDQDDEVLVSGPGHNSFVETPGGELFTVYHTHYYPHAPSDHRQMALDRAGFHADGTPYVNAPTLAPQLRPLDQLGLRQLLTEAQADSPETAECLTDGDYGISQTSKDRGWRGTDLMFSWDEPVTLQALVIYAAPGQGSGRILLDDKQIALDLSTLSGIPGESLRFHFEPTEVSCLQLIMDQPDGIIYELIA
ncbi:glycoside hydrolase family 43 protein, partial [Eubacteriales bacterium OttesenSCG-928-N13]|nr:glycoside hydrolase family 43 protein [Eubacteriales bacterium OttesenSCG-928-N13]